MIVDTTNITGTCSYNGSDIRFEFNSKDKRYTLNVAVGEGRAVLSEDGNGVRLFSAPTMKTADSVKLYQLLCDALEKDIKPHVEGRR